MRRWDVRGKPGAGTGGLGTGGGVGGSTPETITLKDGHQVTGRGGRGEAAGVVCRPGFRRSPDSPRSGRRPGQAGERARRRVRPAQSRTRSLRVLDSRALKASPVKELVQTFGEAVVSIETPSGKGSGFIVNADGFAITNTTSSRARRGSRRPLSERARRPGAAADRECRDRRLESVFRPRADQAAAAEELEIRTRCWVTLRK